MALFTFKGGIHPNDGKSLAKDKAIVSILPKGDLVYPLSQHIGALATPIVEVGDAVLKGQKIAEAGGFVSAPIYASVSGTVKAIEQRFNPTGSKVDCIVIENDGEYKEVEYSSVKPFSELTKVSKKPPYRLVCKVVRRNIFLFFEFFPFFISACR